MNVHASGGKHPGTAVPACRGPGTARPMEPARWAGAARALAPAPAPAPAPVCSGQLHWLAVKASKRCAKQAGGPGWAGSPETEMEEQKEAMWASLAGACGGTEGGKGEAAEGGLQ